MTPSEKLADLERAWRAIREQLLLPDLSPEAEATIRRQVRQFEDAIIELREAIQRDRKASSADA